MSKKTLIQIQILIDGKIVHTQNVETVIDTSKIGNYINILNHAGEIIEPGKTYYYTTIIEIIKNKYGIKKRAAEYRLKKMIEEGVVVKENRKYYLKTI